MSEAATNQRLIRACFAIVDNRCKILLAKLKPWRLYNNAKIRARIQEGDEIEKELLELNCCFKEKNQ